MLLKKEQLGCKLGTSVLGFEKEVEDYLDDGFIEKYGVGLFANEEASTESIHIKDMAKPIAMLRNEQSKK